MISEQQFGNHMSSSEILAHVQLGAGKNLEKASEEAYASGLGGDIKKNWVQKPLTIWHRDGKMHLADGHHRLAVAHGIDKDRKIPVQHQFPNF